MKTWIYTAWISNELKILGKNSKIVPPFNLIGGKYILIGKNTTISKNSVLNAWSKYKTYTYNPLIKIGNKVHLGEECHISAIRSVTIGDNVLTGRRVTIVDNSHGEINIDDLKIAPKERKLVSKGNIMIGKNVWIGDKVTILPGVTIGEGSIIGTNSVVTKNVPSYSVVGGIPAIVLKKIAND